MFFFSEPKLEIVELKKFDKLDLQDDEKINGEENHIEQGEDAAEVSIVGTNY